MKNKTLLDMLLDDFFYGPHNTEWTVGPRGPDGYAEFYLKADMQEFENQPEPGSVN